MFKKSFRILIITIFTTFLISCKKDNVDKKDQNKPIPTTNRSELTKDSIFLYAKEVYLWNTTLPTYAVFKPRDYNKYSNQLDNFNDVLLKITKYSNYENVSGYPNETKYSYIDDSDVDGQIARADKSYVDLEGKGNDIGYSLLTVKSGNNFAIYFRYTSPGSPAYLAGLRRGDYINEINGIRFGTNYNAEIDNLLNILNSDPSTIRLSGYKKNGNPYNITLTKATYNSSPIYKDTILSVGGKKIGYLAYARFSNTSNSNSLLNSIFENFSGEGVTDLIIDLRYNGGGYVHTARHLANLIAPTSLQGRVMFAEHFNSTMQSGKATILKNQLALDENGNVEMENGKAVTYNDYSYTVARNTFRFDKTGSLNNIQKVVFIVSDYTASASELLINIFKPYLDVKLVGATTYGKPVGFFPIRIDEYDVYYSMFTSKNSANQGDYYNGMVPDVLEKDDATRDFGNPEELRIAKAINYITKGSFTTSASTSKTMSVKGVKSNAELIKVEDAFDPKDFKGMIHIPSEMKNK